MKTDSIKRIKLLLVLLLLTSALAACVQKSSNGGETTTEDGKIIVNIGRSVGSNPKLPEGDTFEDNAYTRAAEEELDIEIRNAFEADGEDYSRQVALAISSGDLPDMMIVDREELKDLVDNDLIEDLSDVFEENASDYIKETYASYDNRPLEDATFEDNLMALPGTESLAAPQMVWIREDWLEELDLTIDEEGDRLITLDELEEVAEAFMENDPGDSGNPVGIPFDSYLNGADYGGVFTMNSIAAVFDGQPKKYLIEEDGSVTYGSTSEGTKQGLEVMNEWFDKGIIDPQFGTRSFDDIMSLLTNGQTGIATGPWHIPDWGFSTVREMDNDARFAAYVLADDDGNVNVFEQNTTGRFMVVREGYEHPEKAVQMLNLFYDVMLNKEEADMENKFPEVAEYLEQGVDDSTKPFNIVLLPNQKYLDDYQDIQAVLNEEMTVGEITDSQVRQNINGIIEYMETPEDALTNGWSNYHSRIVGWSLMNKLTEEARFNWVETAYVNNTPTMEQKGANLIKLEEEDFIKIVTGVEPIDYFDTFVDKWKNQGGKEMLDEIEEELAEQE
ncbi:putative aldouronate transport system substrate-binding protein [Virgibacillus halotolerans]|uniref:extracellular solute-binding protein n=1 Tax=Virgibacillus halotolerans TaxID=1071053 RepID=UPI001960D595|nr:extracellular solute-binding protein [Virgibacillus halotolerans]MBM7599627.1 putative aldouronate transport system substrate-binding protein [Virgibacillus halotolerans]